MSDLSMGPPSSFAALLDLDSRAQVLELAPFKATTPVTDDFDEAFE